MGLFSSLFGGGKSGGSTGDSSGLAGTGYNRVQTFTPEQKQLFQRLFGQVGQDTQLGRMAAGDQSQFEQLEQPALQQFQGLQGQLASRFSGMGSGARRSSGFQNTTNAAAGNFASQLQSQRLGLQRQAMQDLTSMSHQLLGQSPNAYIPQQKPFWQELGIAGASGVGQGLGMLPGLFL